MDLVNQNLFLYCTYILFPSSRAETINILSLPAHLVKNKVTGPFLDFETQIITYSVQTTASNHYTKGIKLKRSGFITYDLKMYIA